MTTIILTSGTTWATPGDWNNANNSIECWGAGAGGSSANLDSTAGAGGGGGWAKVVNQTSSGTKNIQIGAAGTGETGGAIATDGTDTWWSSSATVNGVGGKKAIGTAGGAGGSGNTGSSTANGGAGGNPGVAATGNGGGGAAGPNGGGQIGGNGTASADFPGASGGTGNNGLGGAGGTGGTSAPTNGSAGGANADGGGGGGGGGDKSSPPSGGNGGAGGLPGGGGGGGDGFSVSNTSGGNGGGGQIRIIYTPATTTIGANWTTVPDKYAYARGNGPAREHDARLDFVGWQRAPLAASGPAEMALGRTYEVPYNNRAAQLRLHSMQGWQRPPLSGAFVNASPPEPVYDLPQRGRQKASFDGWLQHPLSDDSLPEIRQQPYYVPERDRARLWIKHDLSGWQRPPIVPELDLICRWWYDLPQRTWRTGKHDYSGWQRGVIPDEYDVPLPHTALPTRTWVYGRNSYQGWTAVAPPLDIVQPPIQPFYDLPQRTWTSGRTSYGGWQLPPQPEIMSPPAPQYDVPRGRYNASRYQDWFAHPLPDEYGVPRPQMDLPPRGVQTKNEYQGMAAAPAPDEVFPPFQSSMFFALPPVSRAGSWRLQQAYIGTTAAPAPGNVAPAIPHTWLPLVGVGNGGP